MIKSIHHFGPFLKEQNLLDSFAEIGVAEGRSSLEFMNWGFKKCYLVDTWKHLNQPGDGNQPQSWHDNNLRMCKESLKGYDVTYLQGDSVDMADKVEDGSLSFVYIDANHSYQGALADLEAWVPKIKRGGICSGHDFNSTYGVREAVWAFLKSDSIAHTLPELAVENQGFWFYVNDIPC